MPVAGSKPLLCGIQASDFSGAEDLPSVLAQVSLLIEGTNLIYGKVYEKRDLACIIKKYNKNALRLICYNF